jgi:hypothetical protein
MRHGILVLLGLSCAAAGEVCAGELQPFQASFNVTWRGLSAGKSQLTLEHLPDGRWSYSSRSAARGLFKIAVSNDLTQRSIFSIRDGRVVPEEFKTDYGKAGANREVNLKFDWNDGQVTGIAETKPVNAPLQPGMQDPMSVQVALMQELLQGRSPERFQMFDKNKVKEYLYTREGSETLQTVLGERNTVIYRSSRGTSEHGTWFWCVPELGYLPVKVERRNGKKIEWSMALERATTASTP